jgi:hypothetical protein
MAQIQWPAARWDTAALPDCVALMEQEMREAGDGVPAAPQKMEKADGRPVPCGAFLV